MAFSSRTTRTQSNIHKLIARFATLRRIALFSQTVLAPTPPLQEEPPPPGRVGSIACGRVAVLMANRQSLREDVMSSAQRKKRRTHTRSGTGRTKAKNKTIRSTTKALANTAEHVKKHELIKPRRAPRPRSAAPNGSAGPERKPAPNGTGARTVTASVEKPSDVAEVLTAAAANENSDLRSAGAGPTQIMVFWSPMAMLLRQQSVLTSMMLNVIHSQQYWARAFSR